MRTPARWISSISGKVGEKFIEAGRRVEIPEPCANDPSLNKLSQESYQDRVPRLTDENSDAFNPSVVAARVEATFCIAVARPTG